MNSPKRPNNINGLSKSDGEDKVISLLDKHFIIRVSWAFGDNGSNLINTIIRLGRERGEVKGVDDQFGSPTYSYDTAELIAELIVTEKYCIYHETNEGFCSWHEFAREIFRQTDLDIKVVPFDSSAFPVKALRSKNCRLSKVSLDKAGFK